MSPHARPLLSLACACAALLSVACGDVLDPNRGFCSNLVIGKTGGREVVISYTSDPDAVLLLPALGLPKQKLQGVEVTACNPTGNSPFLLANDGKNISGELHCNFIEKPRCPRGIKVIVKEYYIPNVK